MYAIVDIAGQQFKVEAGMEIFVNRLAAEKGAAVEFEKVLLVAEGESVKVGAPYVDGAKVDTNEVLIRSVFALLEFEVHYCETEQKPISKNLERAKDDLHDYLASK